MPDDFTHQGESSGTQWVNKAVSADLTYIIRFFRLDQIRLGFLAIKWNLTIKWPEGRQD
jgi:hypothetical protein